jgi:hypothetical protein
MIRRLLTTARTVLALAVDAARDLRDEARTCARDRFEYEPDDPAPTDADLDAIEIASAEVRRLTEVVSEMLARRERLIRAAFASGYVAAAGPGSTPAHMRKRLEEYVQAVLRG